jgi:hypothetical protein
VHTPHELTVGVVLSVGLAGCTTAQPFHPNIPQGGRAVSIAVNPTKVQDVIVASESGGAFRTADGGAKWTLIGSLSTHMVTDVGYAPGNPNILIATAAIVIPGTAVDFRATPVPIWRSTDGGQTWQAPVGSVPIDAAACPARVGAYSVSFEPGTSSVYVGTDCGVAKSGDLGATWTHVRLNPNRAILPDKSQNRVWSVVAVANGRVYAAAQDGIWSSGDSGFTWNRSQNAGDAQPWITHAFAASPFDNSHVFLASWSNQLYVSATAGWTWTAVPSPVTGNRPAFVRSARAVSGGANQFDVYFSDGRDLHRQTFTDTPAGPVGSGTWTALKSDHADPADVAFDPAGRFPVLLASDGGVHRTADSGATWTLTGGGSGGFQALQITEVTGEEVSGPPRHRDLYFGTQDNAIRGSQDDGATWPHALGGEGFYLSTPAKSGDHLDRTVTGVVCGPCSNFLAAAHLIANTSFPNAPDGDSKNDIDGNPFLIQVPDYIQNTINNDLASPVNTFRLTEDRGTSWRPAFTIGEEVRGIPHIAGPFHNLPTIYHGVRRPGTAAGDLERIGLVKVTDVFATSATVAPADVAGFGSLGYFQTQFAWYLVYGVSRLDPDHLIIADVEANQMKYSRDGGKTWLADAALTSLVTGNGAYLFRVGASPLVQAIGFDPYDRCHILVGTAQNGVFRSQDRGQSWTQVDGSTSIVNISSFYFPSDGSVVASSYGRGLWLLDVSRTDGCRFNVGPILDERPRLFRIPGGAEVEWRAINDPPMCDGCQTIVVRYGQVLDLDMEGASVRRIAISGGTIHQADRGGYEVPLQIPNTFAAQAGRFGGSEIMAALAKRGAIRGLIVEGDRLVGAILSPAQLPFEPSRVPYVRVLSDNMTGGVPKVVPGARVTILGQGFAPGVPVALRVGDVRVQPPVSADASGSFRVEVTLDRRPGDYEVVVEQQDGRRLIRDRSTVKVVLHDPQAGPGYSVNGPK